MPGLQARPSTPPTCLHLPRHCRDTAESSRLQVRSSTLPEELGGIDFLLTDKTGTLTRNEMLFRKLHLGFAFLSPQARGGPRTTDTQQRFGRTSAHLGRTSGAQARARPGLPLASPHRPFPPQTLGEAQAAVAHAAAGEDDAPPPAGASSDLGEGGGGGGGGGGSGGGGGGGGVLARRREGDASAAVPRSESAFASAVYEAAFLSGGLGCALGRSSRLISARLAVRRRCSRSLSATTCRQSSRSAGGRPAGSSRAPDLGQSRAISGNLGRSRAISGRPPRSSRASRAPRRTSSRSSSSRRAAGWCCTSGLRLASWCARFPEMTRDSPRWPEVTRDSPI